MGLVSGLLLATPFDTIFSDPASFFLSALIMVFAVFFIIGMALIATYPEVPYYSPKDGKGNKKGR